MSAQEAFDKVATHLFTQGHRCFVDFFENVAYAGCQYRMVMPDGTVERCAIGALIPDDLYLPEFEGKPIRKLLDYPELDTLFAGLGLDFLMGLQHVHDTSMYWEVEGLGEVKFQLGKLATKYKLDSSILDRLCPEG